MQSSQETDRHLSCSTAARLIVDQAKKPMKHIVLDISSIAEYPELLSYNDPTLRVHISELCENEFRDRIALSSRFRPILVILDTARAAGLLITHSRVDAADARWDEYLRITKLRGELSELDETILELAIALRKESAQAEIWIATLRESLSSHALHLGIDAMPPYIVRKYVAQDATKDSTVAELTRRWRSKQRITFRASLSIAVVLLIVAIGGASNLERLLGWTGPWGVIVGLPLTGIVLYWIRCHYRLAYGIFEFLVGGAIGGSSFLPGFAIPDIDFKFLVQLTSGLYVMVRGLDNIEKGLVGTQYKEVFSKWFSTPYDPV